MLTSILINFLIKLFSRYIKVILVKIAENVFFFRFWFALFLKCICEQSVFIFRGCNYWSACNIFEVNKRKTKHICNRMHKCVNDVDIFYGKSGDSYCKRNFDKLS